MTGIAYKREEEDKLDDNTTAVCFDEEANLDGDSFESDECERVGTFTTFSSEFDALGPLSCMWDNFVLALPDGLVCR